MLGHQHRSDAGKPKIRLRSRVRLARNSPPRQSANSLGHAHVRPASCFLLDSPVFIESDPRRAFIAQPEIVSDAKIGLIEVALPSKDPFDSANGHPLLNAVEVRFRDP